MSAKSSRTLTTEESLGVLERAVSVANQAMCTLKLQRRRLASKEPEDDQFVFRFWADLEYFILSLNHLRRAALLAQRVDPVKDQLQTAIDQFNSDLPNLTMMRDVIEHIEDYGADDGRKHAVSRRQLQVGTWDGTTFRWLKSELNVDDALAACLRLFGEIRSARDSYVKSGY